MEIIVTGPSNIGKTVVATLIRDIVECLGAETVWNDVDAPKYVPSDAKILEGRIIKITVKSHK